MTPDEPSRPSPQNVEDAELRARLDALGGRLAKHEAQAPHSSKAGSSQGPSATGAALGVGFRAASELAGGLLVGGFVGWWIDAAFGTKPFGIIVFLLLGMVAGGWNVYRVAAAPTGARKDTTTESDGPQAG